VNGSEVGAVVGSINGLGWSFACMAGIARKLRGAIFLFSVITTMLEVWLISRAHSRTYTAAFDGQLYARVVLFEIISIIGIVLILRRAHRADSIPSAVSLIVALHFIGLWAATHAKVFLGLSGAMTLTALASLFIPASASGTLVVRGRLAFLGAVNAVALWVAALLPLLN
jgi:hypothetical protein